MKKFVHIYRSIGALCFVLLMGITLVPKNFYHNCIVVVSEHHEQHQAENETHFENKCAICDFTFVNHYFSSPFQYATFHAETSFPIQTQYYLQKYWHVETLFLNKSPPTFIAS